VLDAQSVSSCPVHSPIRVLAAVPTPPPFAGPEISGQMLLENGLGAQFHLYHLRTNGKSSNQAKGRLSVSSVSTAMRLWASLVWTMVRDRPQIVYLYLSQNWSGFLRDALLIVTGWLLGAKVVAHVRGSNFGNFYTHSRLWLKPLIRFVVGRLSRVILLAERFRVQFVELFPAERIRVVYNAVDKQLLATSARAAKQDGRFMILYMGHLSKAKGFDDLLQSAPRVLDAIPTAEFVFAGEWFGGERNILYDEAGRWLHTDAEATRALWNVLRQQYGERLKYAGVLSGDVKVCALTSADVFVLPSYSEGFPMAVLEAMAVRLPLVLTPVGALPEVLQDGVNAIFVAPGDVAGISQALIKLSQDRDLCQKIGTANREMVEARFSSDYLTTSLANIFRECI